MSEKVCSGCQLPLTESNRVKNGVRNGKQRYHSRCRSCHSSFQKKLQKGNESRKEYVRSYLRKVGKVKQYPCETCTKLCYKKYARSFCSDHCRFMAYVTVSSDCWLWNGSLSRGSYGKFSLVGQKSIRAHRASYLLFKGEIPKDAFICHTCDNPQCVKPAHLWIGNARSNKDDQMRKDRGGIKLNTDDVIKIKRLVNDGIGSQRIAEMFNVSCSTISNIKSGRIWSHI